MSGVAIGTVPRRNERNARSHLGITVKWSGQVQNYRSVSIHKATRLVQAACLISAVLAILTADRASLRTANSRQRLVTVCSADC